MSDTPETNKERLLVPPHTVEYVYEAVKRAINLHPSDYRSARAAMRFILKEHEDRMTSIGSPEYRKEEGGTP